MKRPRTQSGPPPPKRRKSQSKPLVATAYIEENIYKAMVENVHDGILLFGPDGKIMEVNTSACKIHGYETCDEMVYQLSKFPEIFDLYDLNDNLIPLDQWPISWALRGKSVIDFECKCVRKDTGKFWYGLYSALPLLDRAGNFLFAIVSIKDISLRKAAEMERARILGEYRAIADSMTDGLVIADPNGNITEMNPAALRLHEFESAGQMTKSLLDFQRIFNIYDSDGRALPFNRWPLSRALYGEVFTGAVVKVCRPDTGKIWYGSYSGTPVRDKDGNFIAAIVNIHEVTDLKRREEELFQSREEWVETFNAIPDLVTLIDKQNRIVRVNKAMAEKLGMPAEKAVGLCCFECFHGAEGPPSTCPHAMMLKDGKGHRMEMHEKSLKGDYIISVTPVFDKNGDIKASVHVARDITERKRMEEALRESERRYRNLFESMDEGFASCEMIYDDTGKPADFRFLDVNPAFAQQTGLQTERVVGRRVREVIPSIEPFWIETCARIVQTGRSERINNPLAELSKHYEVYAWRTDNSRFAAVFSDITERKQAEERLQAKSHELSFANQELEAFSYSVAHDLRNPLHAIIGLLEIARAGSEKLEEGPRVALDYIDQTITRMSQVIADLLALSRITGMELRREPVNLSEIATAIGKELKTADPQREVETVIEPGITANGDPGLIRILLENLLRNAWKFTSKQPAARIEFGAIRQGDVILYFVHDNGAGFDMAGAENLFKPFVRLHDKKEYEGTGIGLATVKRIVDKHMGKVWAKAERNKGATFFFKLS